MKVFLGIVIVTLPLIFRNFVVLFCNKWYYRIIDKKMKSLLKSSLNNKYVLEIDYSIEDVFNEIIDFNANDRILNNKLVKLEKCDLFEIQNYIENMSKNKYIRLKYIFEYSKMESVYWRINARIIPDKYKNSIVKLFFGVLPMLLAFYEEKIKYIINRYFKINLNLFDMYIILCLYLLVFLIFTFIDTGKINTKIYKIKKIIMFIIDKNGVSVSNESTKFSNYRKLKLKSYKRMTKYIYCYDFSTELALDNDKKLRNIFCNLIKSEITFNSYLYNMYKLSNYCNCESHFSDFKINLNKLSDFELFSMYLNIKLTEKHRLYEKYFKFSFLFFTVISICSFILSLLKKMIILCILLL